MDIGRFFSDAMEGIEQTLFPDKPVETFTQAFSGNADMLFADGRTDSLQKLYFSNLRMSPHYPERIAAYNTALNDVGSTAEKVAIAHTAAQEYIRPQAQDYADHQRTFSTLVHNPVGDCDDYANFASGLLVLGGVDKENIFQVTAQVEYERADGTRQGGYHAFVVVKDGDRYHLIDNNLDQVYEFDPADPVIHGHEPGTDQDAVTLSVQHILDIHDLNGFRVTSPAAYEALRNATADVLPQTERLDETLVAAATVPPPDLTS